LSKTRQKRKGKKEAALRRSGWDAFYFVCVLRGEEHDACNSVILIMNHSAGLRPSLCRDLGVRKRRNYVRFTVIHHLEPASNSRLKWHYRQCLFCKRSIIRHIATLSFIQLSLYRNLLKHAPVNSFKTVRSHRRPHLANVLKRDFHPSCARLSVSSCRRIQL